MATRDKIAEIIIEHMADVEEQSDPHIKGASLDAADEILASDPIIAHFEQREANAQVKRLRQDHRCPTCGAEEQ